MEYFSLFSGVGGFEIGIEKADGPSVCVGFSEIDKYASQVLRYRFPNVKNYGDITKINWSEVPDFDLLVGGSPCQDLSVAGKQRGLRGDRSKLFAEYVRALKEKKPSFFIWENVKGALSSNGGRDFAVILNSLAEAGYALWWQVLNAKDFGVPQNRERVFVVGSRDGSPREIFFEREGGTSNTDSYIVAGTVTSRYPASQREGAYIEETGHGRGAEIEGTGKRTKPSEQGVRQDWHQPDCTDSRGGQTYPPNPRIRKLTCTETERLMSWPDGWTKYGINDKGETVEISDTQRYKMCGNGVVSRVVEEIIKHHLLWKSTF